MSEADSTPVLDVREESRFAAGHAVGAVNLPLEALTRRGHELPPKGSVIALFDEDPARRREAAAALQARSYVVREASLTPSDLQERGRSQARLWQPSPFLVEALDGIRALPDAPPPGGLALDVACGSGRDAVYLALQGYQVDAIDVLPDALERAGDLARRCGVRLNAIRQDLKREPVLPADRYGLVTVLRFLHRPLMPVIGQSAAPGGFLVYEGFHHSDAGRGRAALGTDRGLRDGELASAFAGYEPLVARDGVERDGRRFSQLLARRRP